MPDALHDDRQRADARVAQTDGGPAVSDATGDAPALDGEHAPQAAPRSESGAGRARPGWWLGLASVAALAVAALVWWARPAAPSVEAYRDELAALAVPPTQGALEPAAIAARDLLAAAETDPPDPVLARRAAAWFETATQADESGQAALFAGLAWHLAGRDDAADRWYRQVPEDSRYARAARAALR